MSLCVCVGYGEGDRAMREDREERETYRRGPGDCKFQIKCAVLQEAEYFTCTGIVGWHVLVHSQNEQFAQFGWCWHSD